MNNHALTLCVVAGMFFGLYPFLIRASGAHWLIAAFLLQIGSMTVFLPLFASGKTTMPNLLTAGILMVLGAGIMNGLGHLSFQPLLANKSIEVSRLMIVIVVTQVVISMIGGRLFQGEAITPKKFFATAAAIAAVYLANS